MFICVSSSTFPLLEEWVREEEKNRFRNSDTQWSHSNCDELSCSIFSGTFFPRFFLNDSVLWLWIVLSNYGFEFAFTLNFRINSASNRFRLLDATVSSPFTFMRSFFLFIATADTNEEKKSSLKYIQNWPKIRNNFTESKTVQRNGDAGCGDQCDHLWTDEETERDRQHYNSTTFIDANL